MTKKNQIYKCDTCGNIVQVISEGMGELICCGKPMDLLKSKKEDEGQEKHVPVIEKTDNGIKVKVGDIPHPMVENHYIEWIEVEVDGKRCRVFLSPGDVPEAEFCVTGDKITVREYCNVHGLWKTK